MTPGSYAFNVIVGASPVAHHHAGEAPLPGQYIPKQVFVFIGVCPVDLVVRSHDSFWSAFFYSDFEVSEIDFAKGPFIDHAVTIHAVQFLAVGSKMLRTCGNAVALYAPDESRRKFSREVRVLGEILEIASADRAALDVQAGAEDHVHSL